MMKQDQNLISDDELFGNDGELILSDDDLFGADGNLLESDAQQALPTPAGGFEQPEPGFGSPEFLKSAALSTAQTALPGAATALGSLGESVKGVFKGEGWKPPAAHREQVRQDIQSTIEASPQGEMAGNIAGIVGGGGGVMAATKGLSRAAQLGVGSAYDATAGAGEAWEQGGTGQDIAESAGKRVALGAAPSLALEGASLAGRVGLRGGLQAINSASRALAKVGVENPQQKAAVDFITGPQGKEARDALYRQGLDKNFVDVAKDYRTFKEQGFVKNMDDYYKYTGQRIKELGQGRQQLLNQIPDNVPAEPNYTLSFEFRNFLDERLPREVNRSALERAVARYEQATNSNPTVKGQVEALQAFKSEVDAAVPNLFVGQASPFGKQLRQFMTEGVRSNQQQLLNQVDPNLANAFDGYNAQMADMYNTRNLLIAKTRDKTGGLTEKGRFDAAITNPSVEKVRRSATKSSEQALRDRLTGTAREDFDEVARLQNPDLAQVLANSPTAPSNLREAAKGIIAKDMVGSGEANIADIYRRTRPLSRAATVFSNLVNKGGEGSARLLDRTDSVPQHIMNRFQTPDQVGLGSRVGGLIEGSARGAMAQTGDYEVKGQVDTPEFRKDIPNRALQSAVKSMVGREVTQEFLDSLSKQYNMPVWELERIFRKYN